MFCCMFTRKRFLFKGWTYWNFIQRQDLLKFYYSKLLVLNVPPLRVLLVKAPLLTIKVDNSSRDRTYLDPQQRATSDSQRHPGKFKVGAKLSTILLYFTQQKARLKQRKNRYFKRHLSSPLLNCDVHLSYRLHPVSTCSFRKMPSPSTCLSVCKRMYFLIWLYDVSRHTAHTEKY